MIKVVFSNINIKNLTIIYYFNISTVINSYYAGYSFYDQ